MKLTFLGIKKIDNWEHFSWVATVNGIDIEYKTGLGHGVKFKNDYHKNPGKGYIKYDPKCYAKKPKLKDILYSLASDMQCASESFEDFCSNLGYSTDSRKALETYLACQESGHKLRRVMKSKDYLDRILSWEL